MKILSQTPWLTVKHVNQGLEKINYLKTAIRGKCDFTEARQFNLMFKTNVGPIDDGTSFAYLRPETAQQIFTNLKTLLIHLRKHYLLALHK